MVMEKVDEPGDCGGCVEAAEVMGFEDFRLAGIGHGSSHRGFQEAGKDRIDPDSVSSVLAGKGGGETEERRLGRDIGSLPDRWMNRRVTGNENDVPGFPFDHPGQDGFGTLCRAVEIDRHHLVPRFLICTLQ